VAKMLLIAHNPEVEQRGVIAQVTADMVEQVVPQQLGQAVTAEGGRALGERVRPALTVTGLADPVGVKQHAVARAGSKQVGLGRVSAQVKQAEGRRRRQGVEQRRLAAA
jgi:hypothetical protein